MSTAQRRQLTDTELEQALEGCATEPFHTPGSIQPHGIMFVISEPDMTIRQASANLADFIGRPASGLLNQPISDVIGKSQTRTLQSVVTTGELQPVKSTVLTVRTEGALRRFDAMAHRSQGHIVLEMELAPAEERHDDLQQFYDRLRRFSTKLREASTLEKTHQTIVDEIRDLTGIDRVKLYRFDEDWNGAVIAENKADHMPSYLGQHFPSWDIPEPARRLFSKNYLRLIADIHYEPVPIIPTFSPLINEPTDLSYSVLRSVSPVHIEYLDNMNIRASLTISIIQNQTLWGLVACHHNEPKHVPYRARMAAELIGHIFSSHLSTLVESEKADLAQRQRTMLAEVGAALAPERTLSSLLDGTNGMLLVQAMDADGLVCRIDGEMVTFGDVPSKSATRRILAWLEETHPARVFSTHRLGDEIDLPARAVAYAAGLLAVPIENAAGDYVLWFRKEISREVKWAGKPEKQVSVDSASFRLTPRASFDIWREKVSGSALKWTVGQVAAAERIGRMILEKKVKDELRQYEADLNAILKHSSALITMKDTQGRYLFANRSMLQLLEKDVTEVLRRTDDDLFPPEIATRLRESDAQVLTDGEPVTLEEELADGQSRHHMITVKFPLYRPGNEIYALCSIATDISERKRAEGLSRRYARDLETANRNLTRSNQELDEFAYIASHDLKEPLRGIHTIGSILLQDYEDKLDEAACKKLRRVTELSKRMSTLVNDLYYYSRLGRTELAVQQIDLNEVIADVRQTLPALDDDHVRLVTAKPLPSIVCDTLRVTELYRNLVSNAIKYNESDEKRIEVGCAEGENQDRRELVFHVKDNGIGIPEDMHDEVFRIFKRLHKAQDYGGGTGSGLTFVKKIVENHGGRIWLESAVGRGTTFFFTLPGGET